jgi:hypothetical protein
MSSNRRHSPKKTIKKSESATGSWAAAAPISILALGQPLRESSKQLVVCRYVAVLGPLSRVLLGRSRCFILAGCDPI